MYIYIETKLNSEIAIFTNDFAKFLAALKQGIHTVVYTGEICNCHCKHYFEGMRYSAIISEFIHPSGAMYKKYNEGGSKIVGFVNCGYKSMFTFSDKEFFDVGKMVRNFSPTWDSDILLSLAVLLEKSS